MEELPSGERGPTDADLDAVLAASPQTALVTVTHWQDDGSRDSTDLILASARSNGSTSSYATSTTLRGSLRKHSRAVRFARVIERLIAQRIVSSRGMIEAWMTRMQG